jgi:hypothetical protein
MAAAFWGMKGISKQKKLAKKKEEEKKKKKKSNDAIRALEQRQHLTTRYLCSPGRPS